MFYAEFKEGLDYLCLRLPDHEIRDLFNYLDKVTYSQWKQIFSVNTQNRDGKLDHDEFCELMEERRLFKKRLKEHPRKVIDIT